MMDGFLATLEVRDPSLGRMRAYHPQGGHGFVRRKARRSGIGPPRHSRLAHLLCGQR
jgi:hypothetical protein